jgi:hypothetical protein
LMPGGDWADPGIGGEIEVPEYMYATKTGE